TALPVQAAPDHSRGRSHASPDMAAAALADQPDLIVGMMLEAATKSVAFSARDRDQALEWHPAALRRRTRQKELGVQQAFGFLAKRVHVATAEHIERIQVLSLGMKAPLDECDALEFLRDKGTSRQDLLDRRVRIHAKHERGDPGILHTQGAHDARE